jgi:hypothetical protein
LSMPALLVLVRKALDEEIRVLHGELHAATQGENRRPKAIDDLSVMG